MDELVFIANEQVLLDGVVRLDQVQVHPVEEIFPPFQQGVGLGQERPHQLAGGGIAGVNDEGQLLDFLTFPGLQRLNEGHVAVDRKAVGIKVQIKFIRVKVHFLPGDAEPAQKIFVAAAAAVGGLDLLLERVGPLARLFIPQLQLGLHPLPDLLPGLLGQGRWHLLGLLRGVLGPEAVVVGVELPLQLAEHARRLAQQPAVGRCCRHHFLLGFDLLIGVLTDIAQRALDAFAAQPVDDIFHCDVTGQVPQALVPPPFGPQVAEDAVEHRV